VIGAGAAGIAAAITAARAGLRTLLIEQCTQPGGTVVTGHITTLCGLYMNTGGVPRFIYDGLTAEFARDLMKIDGVNAPLRMGRLYALPFRSNSFRQLACRLMVAEKELKTLYSARLIRVATNRNRIEGLVIRSDSELWEIEAGIVIDCSGDAVVARVAGQVILPDDVTSQTPAIMVPVTNVAGSLKSPDRRIQIMLALQHAVNEGTLSREAASVAFMPSLDADSIVLKLNPGVVDPAGLLVHQDKNSPGIKTVRELITFLRAHVAEFNRSRILEDASPLLERSGRRPVGRYVLKGSDVLDASVCENAVTRGCWPIEKWDAQGRQHLRYLPAGKSYDIPAGALQACALNNLLMAGKTISADDDAIASARVIGCCLATGAAAGQMAASLL
jgi:hypothetical protein